MRSIISTLHNYSITRRIIRQKTLKCIKIEEAVSKTISAPLHWNDNHSGGILLSQALTFASSRWWPFTGAPQPTSLLGLQKSDGYGRPLQEALRRWRWRADISHWKTTRCQSWWQQHPDPLRSSLLHRARGRPVGCHQQWRKCYLSSSWKAVQTIHMNADMFFFFLYKTLTRASWDPNPPGPFYSLLP